MYAIRPEREAQSLRMRSTQLIYGILMGFLFGRIERPIQSYSIQFLQ